MARERRIYIRKKFIAWILVAVFIAVAVGGFLTYYFVSDMHYNTQVKAEYKKVLKKLDEKFDTITNFEKRQISSIRFGEETKDGIILEVIEKCYFPSRDIDAFLDAYFIVEHKYYNALLTAERTNDMRGYVEALDECFTNMKFLDREVSYCSPNLEISKDNAEKFNELFNLSTVQTNKNLKSVGFLPHYVKYEGSRLIDNDKKEITYTIKGLCFVEVEGEDGNDILPQKKSIAIVNPSAEKRNVRIYEVDFSFNFTYNPQIIIFNADTSYIGFFRSLNRFLNEDTRIQLNDIQVTHFKYVGDSPLTRMQFGVFDFKKPA